MNSYINATNFFGNTSAQELIDKYGSPLYVYNESIIRKNMRTLTKVVTKYPFTSNFSIKANNNLTILKMALEEGLNCDAMSEGEIRLLMLAGFPSDRIFFVPNNVGDDELLFAIKNNILTSVDSISQLERFGKLNPGGKVALRINPGVGAGHHDKVVTAGKNTKFAVAADDIDAALKVRDKYNLSIVGINQHVGSLFMDPKPFIESCRNILHFAHKFGKLEFIDFGGGFGVPYHKLSGESEFDFDELREQLTALIDEFVAKEGYAPLFKTEPGRFVCCDGGILLGNVYAIKSNAGKKYVGTDLGMNILVRPSLYDSWHDIEVIRDNKVTVPDLSDSKKMEKVTVTGNICESGDIIAKDRELPVIEENDILAVLDSGSYGYSMASNYNLRLRPAEVMIDSNGNPVLIRKRDTYDKLFENFM